MKGRSALFFALMAVAIVAIAGTSNSCVSPEDRYSVEVLLNKPGLSYDLSTLKRAENVVDVNPGLIGVSGEVVVYKSHYHEDLAAILYESGIETGEEKMQKQLSVRLTPRMHEVTEYRYKINFFPPQRTRHGGIEIDVETNKELNEELKNEILNVISSMFYLGKPDFQKITDALHCTITSINFPFKRQH